MASNATKGLSVVKSTTTTSYAAAGDPIAYSYVVTNTGTTTYGYQRRRQPGDLRHLQRDDAWRPRPSRDARAPTR